MDYEDMSRVLDGLWDQNPELFIKWFTANQERLLDYIVSGKDEGDEK